MAGVTNALHIDLKRSQAIGNKGLYDTLHNLMQKMEVARGVLLDADLAVNAQYTLVDSTMFAGTIALGLATTQDNGGVFATALAGAVGTASTNNTADSYGNVLNMVELVDGVTRDPIIDFTTGRKVYGLMQAASTAVDGDAVGGAGTENLQVSFVVVLEDGAVQLVTLNQTVDFAVNRVYALKNEAVISMKDGFKGRPDVIKPETVEPLVRKYEVTAAYVASEVIDITTGAGATAGTATVTGDTVNTLGTSGADFNDNNLRVVTLVGVGAVTKGTYAIRDTATTFHFSEPLSIGDRFEIQVESNN